MNLSRTLTATALVAVGLVLPATTLTPAQAVAPSERAAAKSYVVKASANRDAVVKGGRVVLRGTVKKARRGDRVQVRIRYAGAGWTKSDLTDRLDKKGRFTITDRITSSRTRAYRIVKPASNGRKAGLSKPVRVEVYSWRNLTSLDSVNNVGTRVDADLKINGKSYPDSLRGTTYSAQGGISYNLERRCRQLKGRAGISDSSADTATGTVSLKADGVQKFTGSYRLTQSAPVTVDLTKVFRLSFDWTSTNTAEDQSGAAVALASPQVLCRD